jgi:2-desacetyl-2-hydroxyethyl bacteriochlorophyllide A dehydrogenase
MLSLIFDPTRLHRPYARAYRTLTRRPSLDFGSPLRLADVPEPTIPADRYVKLRTRMCGICGTDLRALGFDGSRTAAPAPGRRPGLVFLGHEIVAEVVALGAAVTTFRVGDRVCIADDKSCETFDLESCAFCAAGLPILCTNKARRRYHDNVGAGWSEYFVRHENQLFRIPDDLPDEVAVLMEPAAVGLHAVLRSPPAPNARVLIVGAGTIGLGIVAALRAAHIEPLDVTVVARHAFQADEALRLGADRVVAASAAGDAAFGSFDVVYDCVASDTTLRDALRWLRPRGSLILVGSNRTPAAVDFTPVWQRELNILGTHGYAHDDWEGRTQHTLARCIEWARTGRLQLGSLLTHRFPLVEYRTALRTAASHYVADGTTVERTGARKVAFEFAS